MRRVAARTSWSMHMRSPRARVTRLVGDDHCKVEDLGNLLDLSEHSPHALLPLSELATARELLRRTHRSHMVGHAPRQRARDE